MSKETLATSECHTRDVTSRMSEKTFLVTGGSQGIGAGIVERLASAGHSVHIFDRVEPSNMSSGITWTDVDLSSIDSVRSSARSLLSSTKIYGLIHCAAHQPFETFDLLSDETWQKTFTVNVSSAFALAQELAPSMRESGEGRIVVLGSSSLFSPPPGMVHYIASKGALTGLVRALALELGGDSITVNAVAPGLTATASAVAHVPTDLFEMVKNHQLIKRTGKISDHVGLVEFLLGSEASFITGQTILVDGGESHL